MFSLVNLWTISCEILQADPCWLEDLATSWLASIIWRIIVKTTSWRTNSSSSDSPSLASKPDSHSYDEANLAAKALKALSVSVPSSIKRSRQNARNSWNDKVRFFLSQVYQDWASQQKMFLLQQTNDVLGRFAVCLLSNQLDHGTASYGSLDRLKCMGCIFGVGT